MRRNVAVRIEPRAFSDIARVHLLPVQRVGDKSGALFAVAVTDLVKAFIEHLVAVARIDDIAGLRGTGLLAPDQQTEDGDEQRLHDRIPFQAMP